MSENPKPRGKRLRLWIGLMAFAALTGLALAARSVMLEGDADGELLAFDTAPLLAARFGAGDAGLPANIEKIRAEYVNGDRSIGYRLDLTGQPARGRAGCAGRLETLLSESQAQAIRGILLSGYPGSTLAQLQKRLSQPALSENDAIIATQLAIWRARYGVEFGQENKLSTAAQALLTDLRAAKPAKAAPWVLDCAPAALIVSDPAQVCGPIRVANRKNAGGLLDLRLESRGGAYFVLPKAGEGPAAYVRAGTSLEGADAGEYYLQLPRGDGRLKLWVRAKDRQPVREDIGYLDAELGRLVIWANEGIMTPSMCVQVSWGEVSAPTAEVLANPMPVDTPPAFETANPFGAPSGGAAGTAIDPQSGATAGSNPFGISGTVGALDATAMPDIPILTPPPGIPIPDPNGTQAQPGAQTPAESPAAPPMQSGTGAGAEPPKLQAAPVQPRHRTARPTEAKDTEETQARDMQTEDTKAEGTQAEESQALAESPSSSPAETPEPKTIAPEVDAIAAPGHLRLRYLSNALIVLRRESITVEPMWEDPDGGTELPEAAMLEWSSSDPSVASLYVNDGLCTIEARSLGACILTLSVRGRPDVFTQIRLTVAEPVRETSEDAAQTLRLRAPRFAGAAEVRGEVSE